MNTEGRRPVAREHIAGEFEELDDKPLHRGCVQGTKDGRKNFRKMSCPDTESADNEIVILRALDYPNIVKYIHAVIPPKDESFDNIREGRTIFDPAGPTPVLYMEFCVLQRPARLGPDGYVLPEAFIWNILRGVAGAFNYAHNGPLTIPKGYDNFGGEMEADQTVVHQDLHHSNFLFKRAESANTYPIVVLGDWGYTQSEKEARNGITMVSRTRNSAAPNTATSAELLEELET